MSIESHSIIILQSNSDHIILFYAGHEDRLLRSVILDLLQTFDDEVATEESTKRFEDHVNGGASLRTDIKSTVYRAVLSKADKAIYDNFLKVTML